MAVDVDRWRTASVEAAAHENHGLAESVALHSHAWDKAQEVRRQIGPLPCDLVGGEISADAAPTPILESLQVAIGHAHGSHPHRVEHRCPGGGRPADRGPR